MFAVFVKCWIHVKYDPLKENIRSLSSCNYFKPMEERTNVHSHWVITNQTKEHKVRTGLSENEIGINFDAVSFS